MVERDASPHVPLVDLGVPCFQKHPVSTTLDLLGSLNHLTENVIAGLCYEFLSDPPAAPHNYRQ